MSGLDDRTMMPAAQTTTFGAGNALPIGTRLGEFEVNGLIGEGGFGIIYLAYDHSLHRRVAVKEYMPSALAAREGQTTVRVRTERDRETFLTGMNSFINEARLLAHFDHPSLIKVYRFWEANGTAYMAMPFYEGATLKQTLGQMDGPPSEAWLKKLLTQLLQALEVIHSEQCFHRDIAPDNILILEEDRPLLLDFGAARRVIGDMTQALTVILKPGYAPIEQYAEAPSMKQGPWTDIYALASVAYFAINGSPPPPSVARMVSDPMTPLAESAAGQYSAGFLHALDSALAIRPEQRPQNVSEFAASLGLRGAQPERPIESMKDERPIGVAAEKPRRKTALLVACALAGVGAVAAGVLYFYGSQPGGTPVPAVEAPKSEPVVEAPKPVPALEAPKPPPPIATLPAPILPQAPRDPVRILEEIFEQRDAGHSVTVSVEKPKVRIGKDPIRFSLRSSKPGHVYLLMVGSDRSHFFLLFPNSLDRNNRIEAKKDLKLPRSGWQMTAAGPAGTNHFVALVSDSPRDFSAAGMRDLEPFAEFPIELAADPSLPALTFAGQACEYERRAVVAVEQANCAESYGAAHFSIEEVGGG